MTPKPSPSLRLLAIVCTAAVFLAGPSWAVSQEVSDHELLAAADARIEKHRQAEAAVLVVDASGNPLPGAKVTVEQTRHAFLFGCNIFKWGKLPDEKMESAYRQHFAELLNYATLPFYWSMYEPRRGQPIHEHTEKVARWCQEHGIATKGHPLAWNSGDPAWLPDDLEEIRRLQMARIEDCVSRFSGLIDRWDVVNEATHFDREEFVKQRSPKLSAMWQKVGQIEFTRECFEHARKANPRATLLINDYRTDPAYEEVIKQLVDKQGKRLYDVIGIQSHMHGGPWSNRKIWEVCQRFAQFGVPLHFTETTILSGQRKGDEAGRPRWPSTPEGEAYQAREVVRFYTMLFSHPAVEAITWWDFSDYQAWQLAPAGLLRSDMTPKPAYQELKKLIKGKWWTQTTLQTAADGTAGFRGFLGDYRVTVTGEGGKATVKQFTLGKGEKNRWVVTLEQ
jgi:endo-1,4-beta-xylanase